MRYVDSYAVHLRARALRARRMGVLLRRLVRAGGRWWRRLGAAAPGAAGRHTPLVVR